MIVSLELLLFTLLFICPLYWILPSSLNASRLLLLVVTSVLFLFSLSPIIVLGLCVYVLVVALFFLAAGLGVRKEALKIVSWGLFLPIALIEFIPATEAVAWLGWSDTEGATRLTGFAYLGLSYTAIRSFLVVREGLERGAAQFAPSLASLTFFASFPAGPIAGSNPYVASIGVSQPGWQHFAVALSRIGWGLALFLVVKPQIAALGTLGVAVDSSSAMATWIEMYLRFLELFIDFTGTSEIAIGTGMMFGFKLPENFRYPFLARSIQEFWQRWHLSLGNFISTYLFKPLVRLTGKPGLSIFVAFVLVGLWHKVSVTYLLWGVGHGSALFLHMHFRKRFPDLRAGSAASILQSAAGWFLTMTWVAFLSAIAQLDTLTEAQRFVQRLVGLA